LLGSEERLVGAFGAPQVGTVEADAGLNDPMQVGTA
jgi:hypothetical protein